MEGPEAKAQPSMATLATEVDTRPKVLVCGEWCKVLDGYPKDASGHLERGQHFINEVAKLCRACELSTIPGAKPKFGDTNMTSSNSVHFVTTCSRCMWCRLFASLYFCPLIWCTNGGGCYAIILPHRSALVAYNGGTIVGHGPVKTLFLSLILFPMPAH